MKTIIVVLITFVGCKFSYAQESAISIPSHILSNRELEGTVHLKFGDNTMSGFLYKDSVSNECYIITAKHALAKKYKRPITKNKYMYFDSIFHKNHDTIQYFIKYEDKWINTSGIVYFHDRPSVDIMVLQAKLKIEGPGFYSFESRTHGALIGQEVFFIGFPLGLYMYNEVQDIHYPYPLTKKGIISGIHIDRNNNTTYLIDGNNTYGFSGGPVIYYNYLSKKMEILAVTSGYIYQRNTEYLEDGRKFQYKENSGIMLAYSAWHITEILRTIKRK